MLIPKQGKFYRLISCYGGLVFPQREKKENGIYLTKDDIFFFLEDCRIPSKNYNNFSIKILFKDKILYRDYLKDTYEYGIEEVVL